MFFWRLDTFNQNLIETFPEIGNKIAVMQKLYSNQTRVPLSSSFEPIDDLFKQMPDISIDYALMEKAEDVVVAKALFNWDDVGSLDSLQGKLPTDEHNNISRGQNILVDTSNCIVINSIENKKMLFAGLGLNDFIVVLTDDAVLVCPKDKVQDIKKCILEIKNQGLSEWL
jgi:mannose-1-phosphate guanylyltransferase